MDYELFEMFITTGYKFEDISVVAMFDYVNNLAADKMNEGWLVGIRVKEPQRQGAWSFRYIYRELGKDAVYAALTDSDFRGGGTDAKGHEIGVDYKLAKNSDLKLTYFINQINLDDPYDYRRLQADLQLSF